MRSEQLYHHSFLADDVRDGDLFPVGGGMIGSSEMPWKTRIDYDTFYSKFEAAAQQQGVQFQSPAWQEWFAQACPDIDPALASALQTFTSTFEPRRKLQTTSARERNATYAEATDNAPALSDIFNKNQAMCVEISLLAKKFLDQRGIPSRLFSGDMLPKLEEDGVHTPAAHTFLLLQHRGHDYIYDPANPTFRSNQAFFSLFKSSAPFDQHMDQLKSDCLMMETRNIFTKATRYYGVGDSGNVPETLFVHAKTAPAAP